MIGPWAPRRHRSHPVIEVPEGTRAEYDYEIAIPGKVASIGGPDARGAAGCHWTAFPAVGRRDRRAAQPDLAGEPPQQSPSEPGVLNGPLRESVLPRRGLHRQHRR